MWVSLGCTAPSFDKFVMFGVACRHSHIQLHYHCLSPVAPLPPSLHHQHHPHHHNHHNHYHRFIIFISLIIVTIIMVIISIIMLVLAMAFSTQLFDRCICCITNNDTVPLVISERNSLVFRARTSVGCFRAPSRSAACT